MFKRTHTCGELNKSNVGSKVQLNGWVNTVRLHGKIVFVDLRDRYGKTQLVFDENSFNDEFEKIKKFSVEDVISIKGVVENRSDSSINPAMDTGEIEIAITGYTMLNEAAPIPFVLLDAFIEPPCNSIMFLTIFKPRPVCSPNFSGRLL